MTLEESMDLMTVDDLAAMLKVSRQTIHKWHDREYGPPAIKLGKRLYYRRLDVQTWINEEAGQS